ncbi:CPBP family intramembrane glutamic endopeptidase [Corynebacterium vitaeruminis]|uniref:CPBP family intramembrane glutamic endopeptidase n=1 Tax=Corynebacterium vitaeruminis TaxID=38305 RepID=UPI0035E4433E
MRRNPLAAEIALVLAITFGMSGLRSALRLIAAVIDPTPLNEQTTSLNASQSTVPVIDLALQLCSAGVLTAWGLLALFLLSIHRPVPLPRGLSRALTWWQGAAGAAAIGIPGLALYVTAVHLGWSKQVIPAPLEHLWWTVPVLLVWSFANAFAEEIVVVFWLSTRLGQLGASRWAILASTALLRGSYHLYQGFSAGLGNVAMGLAFGYFYLRTGKVWPLVAAHFLIDAVAFVGYSAIGGNLSWLGL